MTVTISELQCPDCGSHKIQIEHVRREPAFYYCLDCENGMTNGTTDKRHFEKKR